MDVNQELTQLEETFSNDERLASFLCKRGDEAQHWLDRLQLLVDNPNLNLRPEMRSSLFTVMVRLSRMSGLHPKCLSIHNVRKLGRFPIAAGGFGDVWKGIVGDSDEHVVCLKVMKVYLTSDVQALFREYLREAIVWRQLKHPNLLPFLGIYYLEDESQFCLVSPWMENGNLVQYLRATQTEDIDHFALVYDVAAGLAYLHSRKVVHGDLKGVNILITPDGRACISDFGLSRIADTHALRLTASSTRPTGTARWLSPEILKGVSGPTKESDIYAFGCVCYEIFTSLQPFHEIPNEMAVALQVMVYNRRPERPQDADKLTDDMWRIMEECWHFDPSSRPTAASLVEEVEKIIDSLAPAPSWGDSMFSRIWDNIKEPSLSIVPDGDWGGSSGSGLGSSRSTTPIGEATSTQPDLIVGEPHITVINPGPTVNLNEEYSELVAHRSRLALYQQSRSPSPTPLSSPTDLSPRPPLAWGAE